MLKKNVLCIMIFLGSMVATQLLFSEDLVPFGFSNQYISTVGFETNQYDWLLDPKDFGKIDKTTIFFSLDAYAGQFGSDTLGDGFRGGYAWMRDGFSPFIALNYLTKSRSDDQSNVDDNTSYDYSTYNQTAGTYGTITKSVGVYSDDNPYQSLMFHFGGEIKNSINFALRIYWLLDRWNGSSTDYTDTYSNTAEVTDASLTSKGNKTDIEYNLLSNKDNILAVEGKTALRFGNIVSSITLGVGLYNLGTSDDNWTQTVTNYNSGTDNTLMDSQTITNKTGSYYYRNGTVYNCFSMSPTDIPDYINRTVLNLDTSTDISLEDTLKLTVPVSFQIFLSPELSENETTTTINYNDAVASLPETSRTEVSEITDLKVDTNVVMSGGALLRKTFTPSDNSSFYIGSGLNLKMNMYSDTRERSSITHTQTDGDGDGLYTTAGSDTDTIDTLSGYKVETSRNEYTIGFTIPVALSYSPVKNLTFHAGAGTMLEVYMTSTTSLTTGDSNYVYETYIDNLDATNSFSQRKINGSDDTNSPVSQFESSFGFDSYGSFGFTLNITDNFKIDAVARSSSLEFDSFSVTGFYSF